MQRGAGCFVPKKPENGRTWRALLLAAPGSHRHSLDPKPRRLVPSEAGPRWVLKAGSVPLACVQRCPQPRCPSAHPLEPLVLSHMSVPRPQLDSAYLASVFSLHTPAPRNHSRGLCSQMLPAHSCVPPSENPAHALSSSPSEQEAQASSSTSGFPGHPGTTAWLIFGGRTLCCSCLNVLSYGFSGSECGLR